MGEYLQASDIYLSVKALPEDEDLTNTINEFIKDEEAMVNGTIANRYKLPIKKETETKDALGIMKAIVRYKVLARLEMFLKLQARNPKQGQAVADKMSYLEMYKDGLEKIMDGKLSLNNVPLIENYVASSFPAAKFERNNPFQW